MSTSTLKRRPPPNFAEVPRDSHGQPLMRTIDADTHRAYIEWLADYLYRPSAVQPAALSVETAWTHISSIDDEITQWIGDHPFEDYPPDYAVHHADILHRAELSQVLSRVAAHDDRRELLDRFYRALEVDSRK